MANFKVRVLKTTNDIAKIWPHQVPGIKFNEKIGKWTIIYHKFRKDSQMVREQTICI